MFRDKSLGDSNWNEDTYVYVLLNLNSVFIDNYNTLGLQNKINAHKNKFIITKIDLIHLLYTISIMLNMDCCIMGNNDNFSLAWF